MMSFEHPSGRHAVRGRFIVEDVGRSWGVSPQATPIGLIVAWVAIANAIGLMLATEAGAFADPEATTGWWAAALVAIEAPLLAGLWHHAAQRRAGGGPFFSLDRATTVLDLPRDQRQIAAADVRSVQVTRGWRMIGPHGNRSETAWVELAVVTPGADGSAERCVLMSGRRAGFRDPTVRLGQQLAEELRVPLEMRAV